MRLLEKTHIIMIHVILAFFLIPAMEIIDEAKTLPSLVEVSKTSCHLQTPDGGRLTFAMNIGL